MDKLPAAGANARQIEYWNGAAGERWAGIAVAQDRMLSGLGRAAMDACGIGPGHAVLDIGCGSGGSTLEIADRVGEDGNVLGLDISAPMLEIGRARFAASADPRVTLELADAAVHPFAPAAFDRAFSRFGVMFFVDPVAAFRNIRAALKQGGRFGFVCWQRLDANPWLKIPLEVACRYVPPPPPPLPEAPGPLSFADTDRVRKIIAEAGFSDFHVEPLECPILVGEEASDSVVKLLATGLAGRLLGGATEDIRARASAELTGLLKPLKTNDGVLMDSASWIVTATAP